MVSEYKSWGMLGFMLFFTLYILLGAQLAKFPRNLEWTLVWISCTAIVTVQDKHTPKEYKVLDGAIVTVQDKVA
ncbi:hypothetical protein LINPERHAP1_LOCUS40057, partial [Linum perenne]